MLGFMGCVVLSKKMQEASTKQEVQYVPFVPSVGGKGDELCTILRSME